ncbi:MAG: LpqB family beta-propeller domain-containing protein [Actinomycetota bacterium]|nr:LpqB family beta-propeller domain-containing protein [Actinomycetota bacterium]
MAGVAALLGLALLLAGCANIPTGGDVSRLTVDGGTGDAALVSLPDGPAKGADQQQILDGFIKAGRGPQTNYQVARQFLTDDFSTKWNPNAGVLISSTPIVSAPLTENTLQISISVAAEVDATGRYTDYAAPQLKPLQFTFAKNKAGEWRIATAPDGTVLTPNRFASIFHAYSLYFFDPSYQYLVPDQRWFADTRSIPTLIVKGLLEGPSDWLAGGVLLSAFPSGTEVTPGSPTIESGRAMVDLSSQVSGESTTSQRRMVQQLTQSLSALGTVRSAAISVGGFPITVPDGPAPDIRQDVLPDPVGFEKGVFGTLIDGTVRAAAGVGPTIDRLAPTGAAVARNGTDVAVLSAAGVSVVRGTAAAVPLDRRAGLAVPSSDPEGFVWSVPTAQPGAILAYDTQGKPHPVAFSYDGTVVSMDVSRDGTRVLIALATASGPKLLLAGVIRDKDLVPTGLGPPVYPAIGSGTLIDASWVDNNSIVVLSQQGTASAVTSYDIGGSTQSLGSVDNGIEVVGGNATAGIRVLDSSGTVFSPSGSFGWQDTGLRASFLASQQ